MSVMKVALAGDALGNYIFGLDPQLLIDSLITMIAMFALFLLLSYLLFVPARNLLHVFSGRNFPLCIPDTGSQA